MSDQPSIFDNPAPRARRTDPDTSHVAAASMTESAKTQRARIWKYLLSVTPRTADELDAELDLRLTTAGRRLPELRERGLVERLEETRPTRSGRPARLWRGVPR